MAKFKSSQIEIKTDSGSSKDVRVHKLDVPMKPSVEEFKFSSLKSAGKGEYAAVKAKFGALAATDSDRHARTRKDARFALNPLLRDPLSVEQEERRAIEEKVRIRIDAVVDEARAKAEGRGYQDGLKRGHDEAFKKFQVEASARTQRFENFLAACDGVKDEIFRANERFVIELIFRVAKSVLLRDLKADREYVLRLARELIERVGVRENITLRINADDMESAGMLKDGLEKALGVLKNLNIEASSEVELGGCLVETEWNVIDASVETQLKGLHAALVEEKA